MNAKYTNLLLFLMIGILTTSCSGYSSYQDPSSTLKFSYPNTMEILSKNIYERQPLSSTHFIYQR